MTTSRFIALASIALGLITLAVYLARRKEKPTPIVILFNSTTPSPEY